MNIETEKLTPNEVEILSRLAMGDIVTEIAEGWGRSKTVIYRHLDQARRVLGARSNFQAVAIWALASASASPLRQNGETRSVENPHTLPKLAAQGGTTAKG